MIRSLHKLAIVILFLEIVFLTAFSARANEPYPKTRQIKNYKNYFGKMVANPYSWLEKTESKEITKWASKQNVYADSFLNTNKIRDLLFAERERLNKYPKYSVLAVTNKKYFSLKIVATTAANITCRIDSGHRN